MTTIIIWTVAVITGLGLLLALALYIVAQRFKVEEDPRIEEVEKVMPGANCGGCGFAGCHAFAEAAVKAPNLDNNYCPVGGNETMKKVAAILGYASTDDLLLHVKSVVDDVVAGPDDRRRIRSRRRCVSSMPVRAAAAGTR